MSIEQIFTYIKSKYKDLVFITDNNVYKIYHDYFNDNVIVFNAGEDNKNLDTVNFIYEKLMEFSVSKNTMIIGVGGGIVTDITGYVASTYLRGLKFGFVSTTLLGMVDASIGGKNGVNYKNYKNIIGTINQPEFVYWSVDFLNSLPEKELHAGFGEILKYAIGFDKELFTILYNSSYEEIVKDDNLLIYIIEKCIDIKNKIVSDDLKENGVRRKLNLGHTLAHAIEKYTHKIIHGEAVGIGLYAMIFYSGVIGKIELPELSDMLKLLERYDLAFFNKYDYKEIFKNSIDNIECDKKKTDLNTIDIVVISGIGECEIKSEDIDEFKKKIQSIFLY